MTKYCSWEWNTDRKEWFTQNSIGLCYPDSKNQNLPTHPFLDSVFHVILNQPIIYMLEIWLGKTCSMLNAYHSVINLRNYNLYSQDKTAIIILVYLLGENYAIEFLMRMFYLPHLYGYAFFFLFSFFLFLFFKTGKLWSLSWN